MTKNSEATEFVVRTKGLTKRFGDLVAVDNVDLGVRRGEIYAFLGRNGAGKTTTIRILLGLMHPSAGEVEIFGRRFAGGQSEPGHAKERAGILGRIGYFVEGATAYPNLTVRENLEIQRRLTGAATSAIEDIIGLLRLGEYAERRAGRLSLGNKQRLSLARALLHSPELVILDEPANGLDPAGIVEIRDLLRSLVADRGVTVFMSSHILGEVEQLADRIGIIHRGRLVEELDRDGLSRRKRRRLEIGVSDKAKAIRVLRDSLGIKAVEDSGNGLVILDAGADPVAVARELVQAGIGLERLLPVEEDLEGHFMSMTGGTE